MTSCGDDLLTHVGLNASLVLNMLNEHPDENVCRGTLTVISESVPRGIKKRLTRDRSHLYEQKDPKRQTPKGTVPLPLPACGYVV